MRAINHALTGAIIGFTINQPVIALPVAIVSHFVCDVIPHHGMDLSVMSAEQWLKSRTFRSMLYIDAGLCFGLVVLLLVRQPAHWWLPAVCAFLAAAPDFLSFRRYARTTANKVWHPGAFSKFAAGIQWFERPIGALVEIVWFAGACLLLAPWLK